MPIVRLQCDLPILHEALHAAPATSMTLEDARSDDGGPYFVFWVSGEDRATFAQAAVDDPTVRSIEPLIEGDAWSLRRVEFARAQGGMASVYDSVVEHDGIILSARGNALGWAFQLCFPDRAALSACYERFRRAGFEPRVRSLSEQDGTLTPDEYGLTTPQREVLKAAAETGYFAVPKETSLVGLADQLGVSDQAISERLRRGMDTLVKNTLGGSDRA